MIVLQDWSKASSDTWKANTITVDGTYVETAWEVSGIEGWNRCSCGWSLPPFLHNQCIKIMDRFQFFPLHGSGHLFPFLVLFPGLATNLNSAVFTTITHGYLGEGSLPPLYIWHFVLGASWVDRGGWRRLGVKVWLEEEKEKKKCVITEKNRKQWMLTPEWILHTLRRVPRWPGLCEREPS